MKTNLDEARTAFRRDFEFPLGRMRAMIASFHAEMDKGLAGEPSSLRMLPTYADIPTGREAGDFLALDLGGTNFRVLLARLAGGGRPPLLRSGKFKLSPEHISSSGEVLFGAIARFIKEFLAGHDLRGTLPLGFTFSFPIRQRGIGSGDLIVWTKGWTASGVEGKDVVALLNGALDAEGLSDVRVVSLDNDTTGTLVARAYFDPDCDIGCILGTGTNACYRERTGAIRKPISAYARERMIVNMESGNFDKDLPRARADELLDARSGNPGGQWEEKMVSGKYLGEIVRLVAADWAGRGLLFGGRRPGLLAEPERFTSEMISEIKADDSTEASGTRACLARGGVDASAAEAAAVRDVCAAVTRRAARIAAAVLAAAATHIDPGLERPHTIAVDGSVFEKIPGFAAEMSAAFRELFGESAPLLRLAPTQDGSGLGAAIIAAAVCAAS